MYNLYVGNTNLICVGLSHNKKITQMKREYMSRPKGYKVTEETKTKIGNGNRGKVRSPEFRKYLSKIQKGRERSHEVYARQLEWMKGHAPASTEAKQNIRMNQPHRNTILCIQTGMYFASSSEVSKWLITDNSCSAQVRVAINRKINYKRLKFIKIDKESIPESKMWRSIDNPNWRGYITEQENVKGFRHE